MNRRIAALTTVALVVVVGSSLAADATPRHPEELTLEPLELVVPTPVDTTLAGGIRLLLFEDHAVPVVTVTAHVSMGARYLPPADRPAYRMLSRLWDDGGAGPYAPEEFDGQVAALGMTLGASARAREASVTAHMARDDLDVGVALWRDLLLEPRWDADRLARAQAQQIKDIQGINDNPNRLANTWFQRLLAGPDTPGGHVFTRAEIESVTRDDVRPDRTVIGVAGDMDLEEALARLEPLLAAWTTSGEAPPLTVWSWEPHPRPGVYLLPGDHNQCHIRMGRPVPDLTESSPDGALAKLVSFGVGYLRVYYEIRRAGLSYGTATILDVDADRATFRLSGSTQPDRVLDLFGSARGQIDRLTDTPLDESALATSRTFLLSRCSPISRTSRWVVRPVSIRH